MELEDPKCYEIVNQISKSILMDISKAKLSSKYKTRPPNSMEWALTWPEHSLEVSLAIGCDVADPGPHELSVSISNGVHQGEGRARVVQTNIFLGLHPVLVIVSV